MLPSEVHIDQALSDFAIGYAQDKSKFIATTVAPVLNVQKLSDYYYVAGKEAFKVRNVARAPGAEFPRIELSISTAKYSCDGFGVEVPVTREEQANADTAISPEQEATALAVDSLQIAYEARVAALAFSGTYMTNTSAAAAGDKFDNAASDPIAVVQTMKEAVSAKLGLKPNLMVIGAAVYTKLRQHPDIIERVKYTQLGKMATAELLAAFFDIDRVVVGEAIYDNSVEGATFNPSYIWGKHALVAYVENGSMPLRKKVTCPIRTFVWTGSPSSGRFAVETYYEPQRKVDVIQTTDYTDEKVIDVDAAYLLTDVVS